MKRLLYILLLSTVVFAACDDEDNYEWGSYQNSPIKSVACTPMFMPLAVSDGTVMAVSENDSLYSINKVFSDGSIKSVSLNFTWSENRSFNPEQNHNNDQDANHSPEGNPSPIQDRIQNIYVDLSNGMFRKNSNDEYYFDYYSANNFGRQYYAVVKFDKDCNILFQIDSTVNAMGGGMGGNTSTVTKLPVAGTPLNNGGYAMILQAPAMGMMQTTDYNLILRMIDSNGKYGSEYTLDFSETVNIEVVTNVNNNIAIYYELSDGSYYYNVYSPIGELIGKYQIATNNNLFNSLTYNDNVFLSGVDLSTGQYFIQQLDQDGNITTEIPLKVAAVLTNITEFDGYRCFSGFTQTDMSGKVSSDSYTNYISNYNGVIILAKDGVMQDPIIADYNNGVIIYATFKNSDGTYTIYLSQVTPITAAVTEYGDKIYIYHTNDLKKLEVN